MAISDLKSEMDRGESSPRWIYRHSFVVRLTHWIIVLCVMVLLASGLQIFNAHPALYWGNQSDFDQPLLSMTAEQRGAGLAGVTTILGQRFTTTGVLGVSPDQFGKPTARGFPAWSTLPGYHDLATGRRWHFFFAWLLVFTGFGYLLYGVISGHVRRDLLPSRRQLRHIGQSIWDHLRLRFLKGEAAKRYNVLQKLSYIFVILFLMPVLILAGLAMSPALDAAFPALPAVFGGRQSARTVHFIAAVLLVGFVIVHVIMVLVSGALNNIRSMITGNYVVESRGPADDEPTKT